MNDDLDPKDRAFLEHARSALDAGAANLGPPTSARLAVARRRALDAIPQNGRAWWQIHPLWMLPAGAVAAILFSLVVPMFAPAPETTAVFEDVDLVATGDNLDVSQDLEFYDWLAEEAPLDDKLLQGPAQEHHAAA